MALTIPSKTNPWRIINPFVKSKIWTDISSQKFRTHSIFQKSFTIVVRPKQTGFLKTKTRVNQFIKTRAVSLDSGGYFPLNLPFILTLAASALVILAALQARQNPGRLCDVRLPKTGEKMQELVSSITELEAPYRPYFSFTNGHFDTIFGAFFRSLPALKFKRECLLTPDGGTVALDWPLDGPDPPHWKGGRTSDRPVLVLLPGLTGGSEDTYIRHCLLGFRARNWHTVVFNSRGCGHSPVTSPQFYSASFTEDLRQVIADVAEKYPRSRIYAVGWSLGANILVRYLGQEGERSPLRGAVSLCNPFDLVQADRSFQKGFNRVYDRNLAKALCRIFQRHALLFSDMPEGFNVQLAGNAKSVRDFDEGLTRVSFGYKSVDDYYLDASSSRAIKDVKVPLLCIQAQDDPIAPSSGIPYRDIQENPNCALIVTPHGGHLGWISGEHAPFGAPWTDPVLLDFLEKLEARNRENALKAELNGAIVVAI